MALSAYIASSTDPLPVADDGGRGYDAPDLRIFVFGLFFIFGGITSLNGQYNRCSDPWPRV